MPVEIFCQGRVACSRRRKRRRSERGWKRRLCGLGWDLRIDRAIFVRPSLTEPPEILNLLLLPFSPFSSTFSSSSFSSSSSGRGKNGGECVVLSTPAPRPPPPNRKPLFFADIAAVRVGQAANRPIGANFFLPHPLTPPRPQEKVKLCRHRLDLGNGVEMIISIKQFVILSGEIQNVGKSRLSKMFLCLGKINIECSKDWGGGEGGRHQLSKMSQLHCGHRQTRGINKSKGNFPDKHTYRVSFYPPPPLLTKY